MEREIIETPLKNHKEELLKNPEELLDALSKNKNPSKKDKIAHKKYKNCIRVKITKKAPKMTIRPLFSF